jgi:hypothetical protein
MVRPYFAPLTLVRRAAAPTAFPSMLDSFRKAVEDLINRATPPEERREAVYRMRDTLVRAKMSLADLRAALEQTRQQLSREERELETMRRRKQLATDIHDDETVALASRYESVHGERVTVLQRKVAAQTDELALVEREVEAMTAEMRQALASGAVSSEPPPASALDVDTPEGAREALATEFDQLGRARARAERDAEAERRLEELKRRRSAEQGR